MSFVKTYENYLSFTMQCVCCFLGSQDGRASVVVSGTSGYGLAACDEHREVTHKVVADLRADDDDQTKALFARHGVAFADPDAQGTA